MVTGVGPGFCILPCEAGLYIIIILKAHSGPGLLGYACGWSMSCRIKHD